MTTTLRARTTAAASLAACVALGVLAAAANGCFIQSTTREGAHASRTHHVPTGGSGGEGAIGGSGGGGAGGEAGQGGGGASPCLPSSEHLADFDIALPGLCLVAKYQAAMQVGFSLSPTWGRHAGPITASYQPSPDDKVVLTRWMLPSGPTGELTAETQDVPVVIAAPAVYFGAQAVDLPFFGWTMVSWTGNYGSTDGEAIFVSNGAVVSRHAALGVFGALGIAGPYTNRLVHTGLGALDDTASPALPALYATDFCPDPPPCDHVTVASWGEANGPVCADQDGNLFALATSFSTSQQTLRAFEASTIAPGAGQAAGNALFTIGGFGSQLAALSPTLIDPGLAIYQPFDSGTYAALDVMAQPYTVAGTDIQPSGAPATALTMATANTPVTLMTDAGGRLWVGIVGASQATTFYVLDRSEVVPL